MTRLVRRRALLIGNEHYDDSRFPPLPSTRADIWGMEQVLRHRNIGGFASIASRENLTAADMQEAVSEFLDACEQDELALVYVSGHGARLVRDGGEFHFIATDTDFDRIAETGVSAGFVNEQLEQCWAPQKVVMIDCCRSGGFAVGLRTSDRQPDSVAKSAEQEQPLLTSRGVYVLSSSRAGEDSYADTDSTGEVRPSAFTAEVIEALRTGKVSKDGKGDVSVEDLFHYVNRRMRAQGARQVPVKFASGVDDRIVIADCPFGAAPLLTPLTRRPTLSSAPQAQAPTRKSASSQPTWRQLLDYYRECVLSDETETPLMSVGDHDTSYVCLSGSERLLSGDVDDDGCIPVPTEAGTLIESAVEQEAELWAGYPAVVLTGPRGGRPWRHPKFAPLLIRRVEVVSEDGRVRLKPYGPVQPHPQLARDWLGDEEAAQLADTFQRPGIAASTTAWPWKRASSSGRSSRSRASRNCFPISSPTASTFTCPAAARATPPCSSQPCPTPPTRGSSWTTSPVSRSRRTASRRQRSPPLRPTRPNAPAHWPCRNQSRHVWSHHCPATRPKPPCCTRP
ncbi:caspase family protein [Streptomyces sp. NPDC006355]|uniref:caspase family protein n=1 Tax=Streptomyces sp. NPDC006355 TaxID=3156758 RepID=UPI0033BD80D9